MSIVSIAEIKSFLGKAADITDAELGRVNLLHRLVERRVKRFVRSSIEQQTHTHLLPAGGDGAGTGEVVDLVGGKAVFDERGRRTRILQLPEVPVRTIASVHEDRAAFAGQGSGDFGSETQLSIGTDFYLDVQQTDFSKTGHLVRIGANWPGRPRTVKVVYTAGYSADELAGDTNDAVLDASDVRLATLIAIRYHFATSGDDNQGPIRSERLGDYTATYAGENAAVSLPGESRRLLQPFVRRTPL